MSELSYMVSLHVSICSSNCKHEIQLSEEIFLSQAQVISVDVSTTELDRFCQYLKTLATNVEQ